MRTFAPALHLPRPGGVPVGARVLLIREAAQQMSSSGCCGRLEGDAVSWAPEGCVFPERRAEMARAGAIYRALKERFGEDVEIEVVDPRNILSWLSMVIRDARRYRAGWRSVWKVVSGLGTSGVIVNGQLVVRGLPEAEHVVRALADQVRREEGGFRSG